MRLALQALFDKDDSTEDDRRRRARIERDLKRDKRSSGFVAKLRSAVANSKLKAPEVFAEESFPDANVVAEYLDCQSESREVEEEYERVCSESPEILAEVGCCYDVLTNRLQKVEEAPKNCRRRLYYVAWEEDLGGGQAPLSSETNCSDKTASVDSNETPSVSISEPLDDSHLHNAFQALDSSDSGNWAEPPKSRDALKKSARRDVRSESDVQRTLRAERSLKRRALGLGRNAAILLAISGGLIWAVGSLGPGTGSETFEIASDETGEERSAGVDNLETSRSYANIERDEAESVVSSYPEIPESDVDAEQTVLVDDSESSDVEVDRVAGGRSALTAALAEDASVLPDANGDEASTASESPARVGGLGTPLEKKRRGIDIPEKNYDAFSAARRF